MMDKKRLIKKARDIPSREFFAQNEYTISEEFRMSKLIDFVLEDLKRGAKHNV